MLMFSSSEHYLDNSMCVMWTKTVSFSYVCLYQDTHTYCHIISANVWCLLAWLYLQLGHDSITIHISNITTSQIVPISCHLTQGYTNTISCPAGDKPDPWVSGEHKPVCHCSLNKYIMYCLNVCTTPTYIIHSLSPDR